MSIPSAYAVAVNVPLPDDDVVKANFEAVIGVTYEPDATLNVVEMFTGTGGTFEDVVGLVERTFGPEGTDDAKNRQMIIPRAAKDLDAPYGWRVNAASRSSLRPRRGAAASMWGRTRRAEPPNLGRGGCA